VHEAARHLDFTIKSFFKRNDSRSTFDVRFFDIRTEQLLGTGTCFARGSQSSRDCLERLQHDVIQRRPVADSDDEAVMYG